MSRIGMTLPQDSASQPLAEHFGKAPWIAIAEAGGTFRFVPNTGGCGGSVARALAAEGVTDVIATHLGAGPFGHLRAAGLRLWQGAPGVAAEELARQLAAGTLPELREATGPGHGHGGHGCGCSH